MSITTVPGQRRPEQIPLLYEDQENQEMGEGTLHTRSIDIVLPAVEVHLEERRPELRVYSNLNMYYPPQPGETPSRSWPNVAPDLMVVEPYQPIPKELSSYTIGQDGPVPLLTMEFLSESTAEDRDLEDKLKIFAMLGVAEYILVDSTGEILPQRLLLRRLQPDGSWKDEQDSDGGVTSILGFRIILEEDGYLRVVDAASGRKYLRPKEGEAEAKARRIAEAYAQAEGEAREQAEQAHRQAEEGRRHAEERLRQAEAELKRLRQAPPPKRGRKKKRKE